MRTVWRGFRAKGLALGLAFAAVAPAGADYEAGQRAWDAGRPAEAVAAWQSAAGTGDGRAMLALGRAYAKGRGAPQDFVEGHKWLNLAASLGSAEAASERDALAKEMTAEERAEARKLARAWKNRGEEAAGRTAARTASAAEAPAGPPPGLPRRALREAQDLLAALGYEPGPADGVWGRRSVEAYRGFLGDAGLTASDTLTPAALQAMQRIAKDRQVKPAKAALPKPPANLHSLVKAGDAAGLKAALPDGVAGRIDARDGRGWTALMHAADRGFAPLVPHLLNAGAKVDLRAPDGATALFIAAAHGHWQVIGLLMKAGANVTIEGPKGRTAVDLARAAWGGPEDLDGKNLDPAIAALVRGRSWAQALAAKKAEEALRRNFPPGEKLRDCAECPEMVIVPAGSFTMGSPKSEEGHDDHQGPQRPVTIGQPFAVGKYEVTFAEWGACVSAGGCVGRRLLDESWSQGHRPMIHVSWDDTQSYLAWLSRKTGKRYRLLTEAEWEYAARAGTTGPFHFGTTISTDQANYAGGYTYGSGRKGVNREETVPVGSFPANRFGLHDMHGNVWEWLEDCRHDSYEGAPSDGSAWTTGGDCGSRVLRGGSWYSEPRDLRSAFRIWAETGFSNHDVGFRVARTLAP